MPVVDDSIVINRPRSAVFAFADDPHNIARYSSNLTTYEQMTEGPVGKGTRNRGAIRVAGRQIEFTAEVTEFEVDGRLVSRSIESPVPFVLDMTYEDVDDGTRVLWHQDSPPFWGFFGKLTDPLVTRMYAKNLRSNLENLKDLLETE